jgi:hypothetical protein
MAMRFVTETDTNGIDIERPRLYGQSISCCRLRHLVVEYGLRCYSPNVGVSSPTCMLDEALPVASDRMLCFLATDIAQEWRSVRSVP